MIRKFFLKIVVISFGVCSFASYAEIPEKKIRFSYTNEDLINIIYFLSEEKDVNVLLPQGANAIKSKVTLSVAHQISLDEAWSLLNTVLDVAGYTMTKEGDDYRVLKKDAGKDTNNARNPMAIYIGVKPSDLPNTDEFVRCLYYFSNLKVDTDPRNEVNEILQELLPVGTVYKFDPVSNAVLITSRAAVIKNALETIVELDQVSFQEKMLFLELHYTQATMVAELFNSNILKPGNTNRYYLDTRKQPENSYFSPHARIIAVPHRNALILLGRTQAVDRLHDFIKQNIDIEPRTGNSMLHTYQLQYLDAVEFAKVLGDIISASRSGGTGQSFAGEGKSTVEREFDDVIIRADRPADAETSNYFGGNKLVVACKHDDWVQIKKLIEDLDTPQPQVLLEILVADLTLDDTRILGTLARNPAKIPLLSGMQVQSGQLPLGVNGAYGIVTNNVDNPTTVAGNLLRDAFNDSNEPVNLGTKSAAAYTPVGGMVLSLNDNDGNTWSIMQIMQRFNYSKILSHPHIIAVNNKEAMVAVGEQRYLVDAATGSSSTTVQNIKPIDADLTVRITPRISSANTVTLSVTVDVDNFLPGSNTSNARATRKVSTTAVVANNAIFALGGLVSVDGTQGVNQLPVLSKVPIIGWFFKRQQGDATKNNLTVFISPTIIQPRLRQGMDRYTGDYIDVARRYANEGDLFDNLHQPINRWFFKSGLNMEGITEAFVKNDDLVLSLDRRIPPPPAKAKKKKVVHKNEDALLEESVHHELAKEYDAIEGTEVGFKESHPELEKAQEEELVSPEDDIPDFNDPYPKKDSINKEKLFVKNKPQKTTKKDTSSLKKILLDERNPFEKTVSIAQKASDAERSIPLKKVVQNDVNPFAKKETKEQC